MKVVTIVGARPQFIKAGVVSRTFSSASDVEELIVHTGQHYDATMSDIFFREFEIPKPQFHLGVGSGSHGLQTGRMLEKIESVLLGEKPDWVLVYGDTNSTLAGALAAVKQHIKVAHVEAGLRSFNRLMPEEINRILTDHASDLLFAPTLTARTNLGFEGISGDRVIISGDVMLDAAMYYAKMAKNEAVVKYGVVPGHYILATIHRAENTDDPDRLTAIMEGFVRVSDKMPIVLPLHPRTRNTLLSSNSLERYGNKLLFIDPVGYFDMISLEKNACLIATDSGGVQKEAFFFGVPCVTLRNETEWVELVEAGWNLIIPPISAKNVAEGLQQGLMLSPPGKPDFYGNGNAGEIIVQALLRK
ncbi:MAG TPA: UDP-N-acetylglucosamine 2-epimerase (non-hydrolyzing) [Firmicutes bacterium]|jgi:UDP-GlcNAc3NAcA epimerase|nr:UDP-N-acetylglucosamine 2-epimerase (non-hydrolyzing) [Bacillota bacterium]HBQ85676.1 UDP-N-acetylglucosamine 2-epimerase (non-hydrolyzing) [Syntrophomonas sp.]